MRNFCFYLLLLFALPVFAGGDKDEEEKIPSKVEKSVSELSLYLTKDLSSEREKVRALYKWVTENIAYDYALTQKGKVSFFKGPEAVLKSKKAVCTGYTLLLGSMLNEVGIEWEEVQGYTNSHSPYFIPSIVLDDHSWIAIKIDGEWKLADPTWDAGYIGALFKESKVMDVEKQEERIEKIKKYNKKLKQKGKVELKVPEIDTIPKKPYNGQVGFVPDPGEKWFLVSSDSFLTRHLPTNPMWQLRHDTIGVTDFIQGPARVKMHCDKMYEESFFDYSAYLAEYEQLNYLEKQLFLGEDAVEYFPNNKRAKAMRYFRFLQVLNDKESQKFIKESLPEKESRGMRKQMIQIADTTQAYMSIAERMENSRNKELESFYSESFKSAKKHDKAYSKFLKEEANWHKKTKESYEESLERLDKEATKIGVEKYKLKKKNQSLSASNDGELATNFSTVSETGAALVELGEKFDTLLNSWTASLESPALISVQYRNRYNQYLLENRKKALEQKFTEYNRFIDTLDSRLIFNYSRLEQLYNDSMKNELLPNDLYKMCKQMVTLKKVLEDEIRLAQLNGNISNGEELENEVALFVFAHLKKNEEAIENSRSHVNWALANFKTVEKEWKQLAKLTKEQHKLTKKKIEFLEENAENDHKRELDLALTVKEKTDKWKKELE